MGRKSFTVAPSAARLTNSLRDIGYDLPSAVADLVDNSVAAGAGRVEIVFDTTADDPRILIADDGGGMSANQLNEALRFGTRRTYTSGELGRYGLGLKTASLSQGRRLTVVSRRPPAGPVAVRQLDLDTIADFDEWLIVHPGNTASVLRARELLAEQFNTVVVWECLDRLLPGERGTGYARRRLSTWKSRTRDHLAMVFHRFLDPSASRPLTISVDGEKVEPWDPFATGETATHELPQQSFEIPAENGHGVVRLRRWVLPTRQSFSSPAEFDRAAGPRKWNRQQGLYVYRADRLVQWGGWAGVRGIDEHTKLARCALDFGTDLDSVFNINVAKMRVAVPSSLRTMLERPVQEACQAAETAYRKSSRHGGAEQGRAAADISATEGSNGSQDLSGAGLALLAAAVQAGRLDALGEIVAVVGAHDPDLVRSLGLAGL